MKTLFKLPTILVLAGLMTIQVSVAFADNDGSKSIPTDEKVYHSSECSGYGSKPGDPYKYGNKIKNRTSTTITIICPIVHDYVNNFISGNSTKILEVVVNIHNPKGKKTACTLLLYGKGSFLASHNKSISSRYTRSFVLGINRRTHKDLENYPSEYALTCRIPPGGELHSYQAVEYL